MNAQNQIQTFQFQLNQSVRVEIKDGEPYFCLSDVAEILEIKNPNQTRFSLKEAGVHKMYTSHESGKKLTTFINEPNLYRVIFRSNKQEAVKFQDWIFEKVIPQIRKTGSYSIQEQQLPPANPYAISQQDERDFTVPLATYALKLSGYLAKAKGVSPAQIQQQAVEKLSCYKRIDFCRQEQSGFFRKAVEWMHEELDKLSAVDFGVSRKDLLNIFKRQCAYKRQFENWNDYQLQSWLDEKFFNNHTERYRGFPTSLESASYKQLEKLVDAMKHLLANDFKLLDLSQQEKNKLLPQLKANGSFIGKVLCNFGSKKQDDGDVAVALQEMAALNHVFNTLLVYNYDDDFVDEISMGKMQYAHDILNSLMTMLMEAAAETLKH